MRCQHKNLKIENQFNIRTSKIGGIFIIGNMQIFLAETDL
jgi:hypothetical protein